MSDLDNQKHEPPRTTEQVFEGGTPPPPPAHPNPAVLEEAGSRALSEALRSSFIIVKILMVGLVVLFFFSGMFTVPSQERAIVLRFGKPLGVGQQQLLGPGLHWSFPSPIDEVVRIPIGEVQVVTSTAGWYQTTPEAEAAGTEAPPNMTLNPAVDGYTITSDGNIIHVRATIRYRITDPLAYVLNFVNAPNVMTNAVDNALFFVSAHFTAIGARQDQLAFKDMLMQRVRDLSEREHLGVRIETCDLRIIVPRQVQKIFEAVSDTEVLRRTTRDQAQTYAITNLSTAKGEADAIVNEGKSEATRLLQQVASEAKYFTNQLANYQENPKLFRERLLAESMGRILTNVPVVFSLPPAAAGQEPQVRLLLNAPPRRPPPQPDESAVPRR